MNYNICFFQQDNQVKQQKKQLIKYKEINLSSMLFNKNIAKR